MKIPKAKSLVVKMPKKRNYRIPEGRYAGQVHEVVRLPHPSCKDCEDLFRVVFALQVTGSEKYLNLAKAECFFNLDSGSDMHRLLVALLGKESVDAMSDQEINLETLLAGKVGDVQVEHIITNKSEKFDYPFVHISEVQPAGTWVKETKLETNAPDNPNQTKEETK